MEGVSTWGHSLWWWWGYRSGCGDGGARDAVGGAHIYRPQKKVHAIDLLKRLLLKSTVSNSSESTQERKSENKKKKIRYEEIERLGETPV